MRVANRLILGIIVVQLLWSCTSQAQTYSLVIGIDGLGSYGQNTASTPNLSSLMQGTWSGSQATYQGSTSFHAYAGGNLGTATQQATLSGPSWSTIHSGTWANQHGVTDNSFTGSQIPNNPSYLKVLESRLPSIYTAGVVSWNPINTSILAPDGVNSNLNYRLGTNENDALTTSTSAQQISAMSSTVPGALFVHLDDVDIAGHSSGAYSSNYLSKVNSADTNVGSLLTAVRNRPTFASENWQIVVVADHGHLGAGGHGGQSQMERTLPIIVSSKTVAQGFMPADSRQPSIVDISATVLNHFGVTPPTGQQGQPLGQTTVNLTSRSSLQTGLVAHLGFNGNNQSGVSGAVGGVTVGTVSYVPGKFGEAVTSNYGAGRVQLVQDIATQFGTSQDFSMSMWVKYSSFTGDPAFFSNKNWNSGENTGINLALQTTGNGSLDFNTKAAGGVRRDIEPLGGLQADKWNHIAFNVSRNGKTLLYINGVLYGEVNTTSQGSFVGQFAWTFLNDGTGSYNQGIVQGLMIDEFGAWNRLLTLDDITYLSQSPIVPVPEPVGILLTGGLVIAFIRSWQLRF